MTLQEIEEKISQYKETKEKIEQKLLSQLENIEFKKMQNGNDSVEVQNISDTINTLRLYKNDCEEEIRRLENLKLSHCEKRKKKSSLKSDFYGY
ncbi:MAG: hypothetical protein KA384_07945 [Leptotrichiaceae bacterium]|nr:hypothetical protein [Leptotrichiaceae bacterium]